MDKALDARTPAPNAIQAALDKLCGGCYNFKGSRCCKAAGEFCSHFDARAELARVEKALDLLTRISDDARSTQNTARRFDGFSPMIDRELINEAFILTAARGNS
jgi:hypothetical protein